MVLRLGWLSLCFNGPHGGVLDVRLCQGFEPPDFISLNAVSRNEFDQVDQTSGSEFDAIHHVVGTGVEADANSIFALRHSAVLSLFQPEAADCYYREYGNVTFNGPPEYFLSSFSSITLSIAEPYMPLHMASRSSSRRNGAVCFKTQYRYTS